MSLLLLFRRLIAPLVSGANYRLTARSARLAGLGADHQAITRPACAAHRLESLALANGNTSRLTAVATRVATLALGNDHVG